MINKTNSLFILRLAIGWYFFYAGFTKIIDPAWSAVGYIGSANNLKFIYQFFGSAEMIGVTNLLNEWGLTLVGVVLILGIGNRFASICGIMLMALYYLVLPFPHPDAHSFIIDNHLIFISVFLVLIAFSGEDKITALPKLKLSLPKFLR